MKKLAIGGALAASLLGGSIAIAALTPIGAAFAGDKAQPVAVQAGQDPTPGQGKGAAKGPGERLQTSLDDLVKDGTLTQDQANKVGQKLESSLGKGGPRRPGGFGGQGFLQPGLDAVAKSIGISTDDLKTELKTGKSIAEVATAHGVDPQKVITDLTAAATAKIDEAVQSGKLKSDMADKIKAHLSETISGLVNAKMNGRFGGRGRPGGPGGFGGPNGPAGNGGTANGNGGNASPGLTPGSNAPTTQAPAPTTPDTTAAPDTSAQPSGTLGG
jgi:hypothetical protein